MGPTSALLLRSIALGRTPEYLAAEPTQDAVTSHRDALIEYLALNQIPAFLRKTPNGDMPIILLNQTTYRKLGYFLDDSMGIATSLHPGGGTDHGWFRNRTVLMDLYNPGLRSNSGGEINHTGIAWRDLHDYLEKRKENSRKILDATYLLSREERDSVDYYQRVRRAALFRVPWAFERNSDWRRLPQMLTECPSEHCFDFPVTTGGRDHIRVMKEKLLEMGVQYDKFVASEEGKTFFSRAKEIILQAEWRSAEQMSAHALLDRPELRALADTWLSLLNNAEKIRAMSYLVGVSASQGFLDLLNHLNIDRGINSYLAYSNPRMSALFIYDETPGVEKRFFDATYETRSDRYSFLNDGNNHPIERNHPIHVDPEALEPLAITAPPIPNQPTPPEVETPQAAPEPALSQHWWKRILKRLF